jgi:hypothetical protein
MDLQQNANQNSFAEMPLKDGFNTFAERWVDEKDRRHEAPRVPQRFTAT